MDKEEEKKEIKAEVLSAIERGRIKMRPRWRFVLTTALAATGAVLFLLALLYLGSFILFILHQTGISFVAAFGGRGLGRFFLSLPWLLILLSVAFLVILEVLVRRYKFAYERPLLYSLLAVLVLAVIGAVLVERSGLHRRIFVYARRHDLPVAGPFYRTFGGERLEDIHRGQIVSLSSSTLTLLSDDGSTSTAALTPQTQIPPDTVLQAGATVMVFGEIRNGVIQAEGIVAAP